MIARSPGNLDFRLSMFQVGLRASAFTLTMFSSQMNTGLVTEAQTLIEQIKANMEQITARTRGNPFPTACNRLRC